MAKKTKKTRDEPLPSREDVDLLVDFLNTASPPSESDDALATTEDLDRWLVRHGLADANADATRDADELRNAHELRSGLRELFRRRERSLSEAVLRRLNDAVGEHLSTVRFEADGKAHRVLLDSGWTRARARLVETALAVVNGPRSARFKYCSACGSVFHDDSGNRSAVWCSQRCSNRMSSRNWRNRNPQAAKQKSRRSAMTRLHKEYGSR